MNNSDSTRLNSYTAVLTYCDSSLPVGWYRFVGGAGTVLSATLPNSPACGSVSTGYIKSFTYTNLTNMGQSVTVLYCFNHVNLDLCHFTQNVTITYCNNYYVFYIVPLSVFNCNFRYCTT